jgi:hypothetical protein
MGTDTATVSLGGHVSDSAKGLQMSRFMLVRLGMVQRMMCEVDGRQVKAWPVFKTLKDAKRFAKYAKTDAVPARIGSAYGETLEGHIALALQEGIELAVCPTGWNKDGSPTLGHIRLDSKPHRFQNGND